MRKLDLRMDSAQFQLHADIEERHWWFVARRTILRNIVRSIASPMGGRNQIVVDIGCGTGANLAALASEYRCVGVDTSPEAIKLARERFSDVTFLCGKAPDEIRPWLARADVVLVTDVLEHVFDDRGLLEPIVDICPVGAKLLITVPADMRLWSPHDTAFGHFRRYDAQTLRRVWAGLPVRCRLLSGFNCRLYPAVRATRAVNRILGRSSGAANTDFRMPSGPVNRLLEKVFAGETNRLLAAVDTNHRTYRRGVSLIAVLQREEPATFDVEPRGEQNLPEITAPTQVQLVHL